MNKAESRWDGIKITLFHTHESTAVSVASLFFHACCHPGFLSQTFGTIPGLPQGSRVRCIRDIEVRCWEDMARGLDPALGQAQEGAAAAQGWETAAPTVLSARLPGWLGKAALPSFIE